MYSKILAVSLAGLALAGCASSGNLASLSRVSQETARGEVVKRMFRITDGPLAGGMVVGNYYYWQRAQPVTPAILRDVDGRARRAGCSSGLAPRRESVSARWGPYGPAFAILAVYRCG